MIDIQAAPTTLYVDPKPCVCKEKLYQLAVDHIAIAPWAEEPLATTSKIVRDDRRQRYMLCWENFHGNRLIAQLSFNSGVYLLHYIVYGQRGNQLHRIAMRIDYDEMLARRLIRI